MKKIILALILSSTAALADDSQQLPSHIDGVPVDAVESFPNTKSHELELGVGLYPFNAYNYGLAIEAGYAYHFNSTYGWEILHADQFFSVEKGLTSELADKYQVNPQSIEQINYDFSSDMIYTYANGKFVFLNNAIRYFRASLLLGPGMVSSNERSDFAANFGARFDFFTGDSLTWRFEARDALPFGGIGNILTFSVGTGISF